MPDYLMSIDGETVHGLFQGDSGLARLVEQVLNQVLEAQVSEQLGAERSERTEERQGYRNGVRPRKLTTLVGQLTLRVPQVRDGQFSPELFARYQRSEQALVLALMEMVVNDVSTRKVTAITEELCGTSFSKSTVSALCARLDPVFGAWDLQPRRSLLAGVRETGASRRPKAGLGLGAGLDAAPVVLAVPEPYRRRLRTSNGMERLNEEVRRRERVIRIFPNRETAIRLLGAVLMERHEQWTTGHRYFDMATYWQWRQEQRASVTEGGHLTSLQQKAMGQ